MRCEFAAHRRTGEPVPNCYAIVYAAWQLQGEHPVSRPE
jgi:hypothetical protein